MSSDATSESKSPASSGSTNLRAQPAISQQTPISHREDNLLPPKSNNALGRWRNKSYSVDISDNLASVHGQDKARTFTAFASSKHRPVDFDNRDDEDYEMLEHGTMEITPNSIDDFEPDSDGFRQHLRSFFPNINAYLADRIARQQVIRYSNLWTAKVTHMRLGANCYCGPLCIALGGAAYALDRNENLNETDVSLAQGDAMEEAATDGVLHSGSLPNGIPMPPTASLPAELECQLCYIRQRIMHKSDWIKHVHHDVQPFTCTWDHCRHPGAFNCKADWVRHENEVHRHLEWWTCDTRLCRHTSYQKDNFLQHLVREHKYTDPRWKTKTVMKRSANVESTWQKVEQCHHETPERPKDEPCKFCGRTFPSWEMLTGHMANHLEQIALPVIRLVNKKAKDLAAGIIINPVQETHPRSADDSATAAETSFIARPGQCYQSHLMNPEPEGRSQQSPFTLFNDMAYYEHKMSTELDSRERIGLPSIQMPLLHWPPSGTRPSFHYASNVDGISGAQAGPPYMGGNEDWLEQDSQPPSIAEQGVPVEELRRTTIADRGRSISVKGSPESTDSYQSVIPRRHSLDSEPLRRQASSSRSCDDTTSTDEWLSLSLEDASDIDVSMHISKETRAKALSLLLISFMNWRGCLTFRQCGAGAAQDSAGVSRAAPEPSLFNEATSHASLKRRQENSEEEDENESSSRKKKAPNPRADSTGSADESTLLFACPFYKWRPLAYRPCRAKVLKEISRVKLHLWRCHKIPIYCPRCFSEFAAEDERDTHIREVNCDIKEIKVLEGVTAEQKAKLTRRVNTKLTRREQWNEMYTILFPGEPLPSNPYISEGLLSQELTALQDFMAQQWPIEFELFTANGGIPAELRGHEDVLQAFSASLFEEAVGSTMRQFEEWQRKNKASSPNSGYKSDSTLLLEESNDGAEHTSCDPANKPSVLPFGAQALGANPFDDDEFAWAAWGSEHVSCDKNSGFNLFEALYGNNKDVYDDFLGRSL